MTKKEGKRHWEERGNRQRSTRRHIWAIWPFRIEWQAFRWLKIRFLLPALYLQYIADKVCWGIPNIGHSNLTRISKGPFNDRPFGWACVRLYLLMDRVQWSRRLFATNQDDAKSSADRTDKGAKWKRGPNQPWWFVAAKAGGRAHFKMLAVLT